MPHRRPRPRSSGPVSDRGVTLLEILSALLILAFAFIPIIGVIGTGTTDTDVTNAYIFAQTSARNILDSLLDSVPFPAVTVDTAAVPDLDGTHSEGNVALFQNVPGYDVASFMVMLGNSSGDNKGAGALRDERGNTYYTKLFIFPLVGQDSSNPDPDTELVFSYLPRPLYENATYSAGHATKPGESSWYSDNEWVNPGVLRPYDYAVVATMTNAKGLGVPAGADASLQYCMMKKFLLRIRWTMPKGGERSIEVFTAKADLSL